MVEGDAVAKILISTSSFGKEDPEPLEYCRNKYEVILNPYGRKLTGSELIELAAEAEGIIAGTEKIDRAAMESLPKLRVISRCGVGMDSIDLEAAEQLGIRVYNTPFGPTAAVAELTVGLILDLLRRVTLMDRELRRGIWKKRMGSLLNSKKIGIIGFGRIGEKVAELLIPFGVEIAYTDIIHRESNLSCMPMTMAELLSWADIVTLHNSAAADGKAILGREELKKLKKGSWLLNISRGGLVDEDALYDLLSEGHLAGAALDVYEKEPYNGRLIDLDNIILTPHIGSYAREGRVQMEMDSVKNLLRGMGE